MKYVVNHTHSDTHAHTQTNCEICQQVWFHTCWHISLTLKTLCQKYIDPTDCTCITARTTDISHDMRAEASGSHEDGDSSRVERTYNVCAVHILSQSQLGDHVSLCTISHIHICIYRTCSKAQDNTMFKLYVCVKKKKNWWWWWCSILQLQHLEMFEIGFVFPEIKLTPYVIHAAVLHDGNFSSQQIHKETWVTTLIIIIFWMF